jgi:ABC-type multidrug transport system ATPase subunit/two-component sensor histidine kinase
MTSYGNMQSRTTERAPSPLPLIELRHAAISFGHTQALADISISVFPGEVVAVVGEHGAGKSTLAAAMNGSVQLSSGEIILAGIPHPSFSIRQAHNFGIEMVHQQNLLFDRSTVAENLLMNSQYSRSSTIISTDRILKEASRFLKSYDIAIDPSSRISELKFSDRVLVDILQHVYPRPRLLILDEALEKLSAVAFSKASSILESLSHSGTAIILITHHIDDVSKLADRICILKNGRLLLSEKMGAIDKISIIKMAYTQMEHHEDSNDNDEEFYELLKYNEAILQNLPEILIVVDNQDRIRLVNVSGRAFFDLKEPIGFPLPIESFFGGMSDTICKVLGDSGEKGVGKTHYHVPFDSPKRKIMSDISVIPIFDDAYKIGTIIIIDDVTEQESMREQLVLSEKLASLGLLAAGVAHEINNPLEILKNNVNLLRLLGKDSQTDDLLDELDEELQSIKHITENLITFSDNSSRGIDEFDLSDLIWSLIRLIRKNADEKRIKIEYERDLSKTILIHASKNEIRQVLLNLYKNSFDAMPDGGRIFIGLDEVERQGKAMARLVFRDTGCGLKNDNLLDIFLPFFTTKKTRDNLGLGLSISYGIINKFGGTIQPENVEPSGCQFTIELPLVEQPRR